MLRRDYLIRILDTLNGLTIPTNQTELEAKFGYYTRTHDGNLKFVSDVGWRRFESLKDTLLHLEKPYTTTQITDYIDDDIRKQVISSKGEEDRVVWQRKNTIKHFSDPRVRDYGVRVSINQEEKIAPVTDFVQNTIRIKQRDSFSYNDFLQIDMSVVQTTPRHGKTQTSHEVEIEILKLHQGRLDRKVVEFNNLLYQVFQSLHDTLMLYTVRERQNLARTINDILGEKPGSRLYFEMVAQARNLKLGDIVWGGLIGNSIQSRTGDFVQNHYSVTHKADGIRKFLTINPTGIWIVFPPYEFNLLFRFNRDNNDKSLYGLILDGELVPEGKRRFKNIVGLLESGSNVPGIIEFDPHTRREQLKLHHIPNAEYWFLVFDALAIDANKDIQLQPHATRMVEAYQAVNRLTDVTDNNRLVINFKSFRDLNEPSQFFTLMQRMFAEKNLLPYQDDGFMFTPEMAPYNPLRREMQKRGKIPLYQRRLIWQSDLCKWKPAERLTIDFSVRPRLDGTIELLMLGERGDLIPFQGTKRHPFEIETMVDHGNPLLQAAHVGAIFEFGWDIHRGLLVPHLERTDKRKPNRQDIAEDDWNDIHEPITEKVLKGENFTLMRRYHNRIKRNLFKLSLRSIDREDTFLLDIGSGRGGDVNKWRPFTKIVAVEPDPDHIAELQRRLEMYEMTDRVRIVPTGGQDTKAIQQAVDDFIGKPVDVVSMMLSMTFFWKDEKMLSQLIETIDATLDPRHGQILFMTMDGDTVEEVFDPFFPAFHSRKLIFHHIGGGEGYATLELQPQKDVLSGHGRKAWIYIEDSMVGKKEEVEAPSKEVIQFRGIPVIQREQTFELTPIQHTDIPVIFPPKRVRFEESHKKAVAQEEYLVHLTDFERLLSEKRVITSKKIYRAEREYFLTDAEKDFSLMYSFGTYETESPKPFSFEEEYARWKVLKDLKTTIRGEISQSPKTLSEEQVRRVVWEVNTFFYMLTLVEGEPFKDLPITHPLYQDLKRHLMEAGLSSEKTQNILLAIHGAIEDFLQDPMYWDFANEEGVQETQQGDFTVLQVGEASFYIEPERVEYFKSLLVGDAESRRRAKIVAMLLRHFSVFEEGFQNDTLTFVPKGFVQRVAEQWKDHLILEANVTPLTTQMPFLKGDLKSPTFTSFFPDTDNVFGSLGRIERDIHPSEFPEAFVTMISAFPLDRTVLDRYHTWLKETPQDKFLRILVFVPKTMEQKPYYRDSQRSPFLVYETDVTLSERMHVFVFESTKRSTSEPDYDALFKKLKEDYVHEWEERFAIPPSIEEFIEKRKAEPGMLFYTVDQTFTSSA